jgi:hypothetical protein
MFAPGVPEFVPNHEQKLRRRTDFKERCSQNNPVPSPKPGAICIGLVVRLNKYVYRRTVEAKSREKGNVCDHWIRLIRGTEKAHPHSGFPNAVRK